MVVQHLTGPIPFANVAPGSATGSSRPVHRLLSGNDQLSVFSYNVLLPNSVDGWWMGKMYLPPLLWSSPEQQQISSWPYRRELLRQRIQTVDADVVCLQEVSPLSFDEDFAFMADLGYDGKEMFRKGRFRPATFWKTSKFELVAPAVHKDRTLLTAVHPVVPELSNESVARESASSDIKVPRERKPSSARTWYVLNCHLQAGKEGPRRLRQINEGIRAVLTLARKRKEKNPERNVALIVCGDLNGGEECGAVRFIQDGFVDETFLEDGNPVSSNRKDFPLEHPMTDVMKTVDRPPPPTLVVPELISLMVDGTGGSTAYDNPKLNVDMLERLRRIYSRLATHKLGAETVMNYSDVAKWLTTINGELGRGSEFREAAHQMGWIDVESNGDDEDNDEKSQIDLPLDGLLTLDGFIHVYQKELERGKFWGIAYDMAVLGQPLPDAGVYSARFDRMYCSWAVQPIAVMDFVCRKPCPNDVEPSDHLPVAAAFAGKDIAT